MRLNDLLSSNGYGVYGFEMEKKELWRNNFFQFSKFAIANNRFSKNSEFEFYESENKGKLVFCHTHFLAILSGCWD